MAANKSTVRLWHRSDRPDKKGLCPVHIVYQIKSTRQVFAIPGIKLHPANWSNDQQRATFADKVKKTHPGTDPSLLLTKSDVQEINTKIIEVLHTITKIEKRFTLDGVTYSPGDVIPLLKKTVKAEVKRNEPQHSIIDFIYKFCDDTTEHKPATLREYKSLAWHMENFEKARRQRFTFTGDASILKSFSSYLSGLTYINKSTGKEQFQVNNITKAKLISTLKTILRYAKKAPYKIECNPDYFDFTVVRRESELEIIALTEDELMTIFNLDLEGKRSLDEARDIFVFSCATGFRYGDLKALQRHHIKADNTIIIPSSDKNAKRIEVPLNPFSFAILNKYRHLRTPLPVSARTQKLIADQKLNPNIKKVGKLAGINTEIEKVREFGAIKVSSLVPKWQRLSIHVGRKTFVTISLEKGMPIHEVMAFTTHSTYKVIKRYIDVTGKRKRETMANVWGKVESLKAV